jgi:hypothetical protein
MAQPVEYTYSGAFIPGTLARAEQIGIEYTSVQAGFQALAIQGVDTGTANTYVVATSGGKDGAYSDGLIVEFKAANTCTGGSTISVDSGPAVGLTNQAGQSLSAGAVTAGTWYLCRYNSTYSAFTIVAPTPATVTIGTISGAPPTHPVGLVAAAGVSTAAAPIDVTFALDQTISPTMTGTWTFSGAVSFNSTVTFASGFTLTGAQNAYAITLDGNVTTGKSFGVEINAGTNSSDIAFLVNNQAGSVQFFEINGQGSVTVGSPTGGAQGVGTINATGLFVNGAAVKTTSISSANPTAVIGLTAVNGTALTFMTSDSAPALSQAIAPTMTGKWIFTPSSAVTAVTINAAVNASGMILNGGTNTALKYLLEVLTGQGSGFSGGVSIQAGTTSADYALQVLNAAGNNTLLLVAADGSGQFGYNASGFPALTVQTGGLTLVSASEFAVYSATQVRASFVVTTSGSAPFIQAYGPTAAGLVDMTPDTGTFTITYTGMTGSVTGTAVWQRNGNSVLLFFPAATGTSNATTFTATGLPAEIQPARTQHIAVPYSAIFNGSGYTTGEVDAVVTASSGTITFWYANAANGWQNTLVKGVENGFTIPYLLN